MSAGLMSCVRENSPPLEYDDNTIEPAAVEGPKSLPLAQVYENHGADNFCDKPNLTSSASVLTANDGSADGGNGGREPAPNAEQQKRRRFHPLRNLRRIFRRRTINSVSSDPNKKTAGEAHTRTLPVTRASGGAGGGVTQTVGGSNSEKNLRSATLTSMSSVTSASSPSSPLTHQQLQETYNSQSLPKSKTYANSTQLQRDVLLLGGKSNTNSNNASNRILTRQKIHQTLQHDSNAETSTDYDDITTIEEQNKSGEMYAASTTTVNNTSAFHHQQQQQFQHRLNQSIGVAVLPPIGGSVGVGGNRGRNFFTERQKLRSVDDELDSSEYDSAGPSGGGGGLRRHNGNSNSGDITDSQRSLSEGRLVDSDFTREGLSQSHDSVFSESATASSLSIVLRAELADVLRKRRTRPDGSDEDLGLPRSPGSPQRRAELLEQQNRRPTNATTAPNTSNQSQVSSMSLLSMTSNEGDDFQATSTANNSLIEQHQSTTQATRYIRSATFSSMPAEVLRHPTMSSSFTDTTTTIKRDEVDAFSANDCQRLSHAAAKHKMAIRPVKKNIPTRQHRRTLDRAIPEANEDTKANNFGNSNKPIDTLNTDLKSKSKSLPPCVNAAKLLEQHANELSTNNTTIIECSQSTTTVTTASSNTFMNNKTSSCKSNSDSETFMTSTKISNSSMHKAAGGTKIFNFIGGKENNQKIEKKAETSASTSTVIESTESGFLRRLMQRHSKRNYSKANVGDETDLKDVASEPKKMPISNSCIEMPATHSLTGFTETTAVEKVKSAMSYEQAVEATRKGIQREIKQEGQNGLSAILNNFTTTSQSTPTTSNKSKSGAAARQRYVPQDIAIPQQENFQSTSIVRDINKAAKESVHHFEKKPKIVGLSAFQQKISRSNDSVVRLSSSNNSLETSTDDIFYDEKYDNETVARQRKTVEKSRSFRTYNEVHEENNISNVSSRHNMPSLPDLSVNLRVPNYTQSFILQSNQEPFETQEDAKCASLGFEINDNSLLKPHAPRNADSTGNISVGGNSATNGSTSPYKRNLIVTTTTNGGSNVMPQLSPSNSCQADISEIEQNIDMIVKSPFVSVIRKSANLEQLYDIELEQPTENETIESKKLPQVEIFERTKTTFIAKKGAATPKRPKSLVFKTKSEEQLTIEKPTTPTTAAVPLRSRLKSSYDAKTQKDEQPMLKTKDIERKSAPAVSANVTTNAANTHNNLKITKRSSSMNESSVVEAHPTQIQSNVPEFMKIQLNHVKKANTQAVGNVVLAKNVKENVMPVEKDVIKNTSSQSVVITEQPTLEETLPKQTNKTPEKRLSDFLPKSPTKKKAPTPPATAAISPLAEDEAVQLRPKLDSKQNPKPPANNRISIQERKRLFMGEVTEEKPKTIRKIEEIRIERKKSMSEEVYRKLSTCGRTQEQQQQLKTNEEIKTSTVEETTIQQNLKLANNITTINTTPPTTATTNTIIGTPPTKPTKVNSQPNSPINESNVILRKKSFASSNINNNINESIHKQDSTPELMKVFARRSLKVKDEDIAALAEKINEKKTNTANLANTMPQQQQQQQNFDSDKENQSSSEEKLNKLAVDVEQMSSMTKITNNKLQTTTTNNRSSVADFRHNMAATTTTTTSTAITSKAGNNNNFNNSSNKIQQLPPIKTTNNGFNKTTTFTNGTTEQQRNLTNGNSKPETRTSKINENLNNNNNNNNLNINNFTKRTHERQSLNIIKTMESLKSPAATKQNSKATTANTVVDVETKSTVETTVATTPATATPAPANNKPIERSATVSEFKGIHQRRAEWEQRAKEALK